MEATSVGSTGSAPINGLLYGTKWDTTPVGTGVTLTYSFQNEESVWPFYGPGEEPSFDATPLTAGQIAGLEDALAAWANVADISFQELVDSASVAGDIRFATTSSEGTDYAHAYLPSDFGWGGDVWFLGDDEALLDPTKGGYGFETYLHEIGHTLGLKHPHDSDNGFPIAALSIDSKQFTVMSYRDFVGQNITNTNHSTYYQYTDFYPTTPMLHDVLAIQHLYGANMTDTSDSTYEWAPGEQIYETLWDAGGEDLLDWSNQSSAAFVNLNDGEWSKLGPPIHVMDEDGSELGIHFNGNTLAIAFGAMIENATGGSGNDTLIGNEAENFLEGGDGNDSLVGGTGNDTLDGGDGNDYFVVNSLNDVVIGGGGSDTIQSSVDGYVQPEDVEFLLLPQPPEEPPPEEEPVIDIDELLSGDNGANTLDGGDGNDTLLGNGGNDSVIGGAGNDFMHGNQGSDTLRGGLGDDELRGGQNNDVVYSGQGNDEAFGALGNDELRGGPGDDTISAGQGNDTLFGGAGNDFLQPRLGNDVVTGGAGADLFWFNAAGAADADTIIDFEDDVDKIMLDPAYFGATTFGVNILYDPGTGALSYDADGAGSGAALFVATLQGMPAITEEDLL